MRLAGLAPETLGAEAARLLAGASWSVLPTASADRTGIGKAVLVDATGRRLQTELVAAGLARVWPGSDSALARDLLVHEDLAAAAGRGEWGEGGRFRHETAFPPPAVAGFALVRGRIVSTGSTRGHAYLNFGGRYRQDFTVRLRRGDARDWGLWDQLGELEGRYVEVRGFVFDDGGPMIELDDPSQLRVLP